MKFWSPGAKLFPTWTNKLIRLEKKAKRLNIKSKTYSKQDNVTPQGPPPHNIILFDLDFDVKFPLLCLLQFLRDLKSTIFMHFNWKKIKHYYVCFFRYPKRRCVCGGNCNLWYLNMYPRCTKSNVSKVGINRIIKGYGVISLKIRPLPALYPYILKIRFIERSQWSPEAVCSCLRYIRPFLLHQSKKICGGGYKAASGLISRDIACYGIQN